MPYNFILHEDAWLRDGPAFASGQVIGYRVGGLPDGTTARIANFGTLNRPDWQTMRINADNTQTDWTRHYTDVEEALQALLQDCSPKFPRVKASALACNAGVLFPKPR